MENMIMFLGTWMLNAKRIKSDIVCDYENMSGHLFWSHHNINTT